MFDEALRNYRKDQFKKTFNFDQLRDRRQQQVLEARRVARGRRTNRLRTRQVYCGVITEIEGAPQGPWYLKFDCVPKAWYMQIFHELESWDFDLSSLPETQQGGLVRAADIFQRFLGSQPFVAALASAAPAVRWQVAVLQRWYTLRCSGGADGDMNVPDLSLFEILHSEAQLGPYCGRAAVGTWVEMTLALPERPEHWASGDGWLVDFSDTQLAPQPRELLALTAYAEPWQGMLATLNYPFPEGLELDVDIAGGVVDDGEDSDMGVPSAAATASAHAMDTADTGSAPGTAVSNAPPDEDVVMVPSATTGTGNSDDGSAAMDCSGPA